MRRGEKPAEVRVALWRLDEQRHVRAAVEGQLRARDRPDAEVLRRVRELERAVDPVVVGERERRIAELGRLRRELLGLRGPVEERVGAVGVELDVRWHPSVLHEHTFAFKPDTSDDSHRTWRYRPGARSPAASAGSDTGPKSHARWQARDVAVGVDVCRTPGGFEPRDRSGAGR